MESPKRRDRGINGQWYSGSGPHFLVSLCRCVPLFLVLIQFRADQGKHVSGGILAEENIEVSIIRNHVQRMIAFVPRIKEIESPLLAFGQKAMVVHARQESEPGRRGRLLGNETRRQFMKSIHRNQ